MNFLMTAWSYFATNILQQPAFMIGLIVMLGYILQKKPWYDVLAGVIKAIVGYLILTVGSGGLVFPAGAGRFKGCFPDRCDGN